MNRAKLLALNAVAIRERVLLEKRFCEETEGTWLPFRDELTWQIEFLISTYVSLEKAFGVAPYPDMLLHLGWPGQVLHVLFCQTPGLWEAFRLLVERSPYGLSRRTSLKEGDVLLHSIPERFVYRALVPMTGVVSVDLHPFIPGGLGRMKADFLVRAATGLAVYVEVAMVSSRADGERSFLAGYREKLARKLRLYQTEDIDPVVIWSDQVAAPRALAERLNQIRAQLGLPTRPPAPPAWYEEII